MKFLLTSAYDKHDMLDVLVDMASKDRIGKHSLCQSPEKADAIIFVEDVHFDDYLFSKLRSHPYVSQYKDKVFMYNEADKPWAALPGLYCSMPTRFFQPGKQIPFPYLDLPNDFIKDVYASPVEKRWLFSFVGSASHRCRKEVIKLSENSDGVLDTSDFNVWDCTVSEKASQGNLFAKTMAESHFMLCPRGIGTSSFRLFESMEAGVAPVIISNQWVPPPHVDWSFAVRVNERKIGTIPEVLRAIKDEAADRGQAARAAWESAYAPDVMFDTLGDSIMWLLEEQAFNSENDSTALFRKLIVKTDSMVLNTVKAARRQWNQVLF